MVMNDVYFIVPGDVIPKQRPRFSHGHAYTPKKTLDYEKKVKEAYLKEYPAGIAFKDESLEMLLNVYMAVPKSVSKKKRDHMICFEYPTKRPDSDNLIKSVADALNGVCYTDDAQIVTVQVNKIWSETSKAEILIRVLKRGE